MNSKKFSEAMSELDNKYVDEAINYKKKAKKPGWIKWGAMAACLCLVICAFAIPRLFDNSSAPVPGTGDLVPMIYVNNSLYQYASNQPDLADKESEFIYLGKIESKVNESQEPKVNFQANDDIVGANVYQYGNDIVALIDGKYCLYEIYGKGDPVRGGITPDAVQPDDTDIENTQPAQTDIPRQTTEPTLPNQGGELAIETSNLNIYYLSENGTIESKSVELNCIPKDIFNEWATLNNISDVTLVDCVYDNGGTETVQGEVVEHTNGNYYTLTVTLSSEFSMYAESENGKLLIEALRQTFYEYIHFDEFNLNVL